MSGFAGLSPRSVAAAVGVVGALFALPADGHALTISGDKYCSAAPNTQIVGDTVPGGLLSVNDLTLTINGTAHKASNCYGDYVVDQSNAVAETGALNEIFGAASGPQQLFHLDGTGQDASLTGLGGITFVVSLASGGVDGAPGTWTLAWTDSNGATPGNLPLYVDLAISMMGGKNYAAYLLTSVLLPISPTSGTGTFDIQFLNKGGQQPTISHMTVAGRVGRTPPRLRTVPEPASIAIFGAGLAGLFLMNRRRRAA